MQTKINRKFEMHAIWSDAGDNN